MRHKYSIVLLGDTAEAAKWIGFAKSRSLTLHDNGTIVTYPIPEVFVRVHKTKQFVNIYIETSKQGYYLESGLLQIGSDSNADPSYLYYGDLVQAAHDAGAAQRDAKLVKSGLVSDTYAPGLASEAIGVLSLAEGDEGYDAAVAKIMLRKILQTAVPASQYSGKMRLFVQSLYGSKSTAFRMTASIRPLIEFGSNKSGNVPIELDYEWPNTSGLFTTDDFRYFIIIGRSYAFDFYEVKFSPAGERLRSWIVSNAGSVDDEQLVQHEAYLFTESSLGEKISSCPITLPAGMGGPIAYGWKYKWDGSRASCVLAKENCSGNHSTQLAHVDITFQNEQFNAVLTTDAAKSFTFPKPEWGTIWVPDHVNGGHDTHVFECCPDTFDSNATYSNIPIYCYYDPDDVLKQVEWDQSGGTDPGTYSYTGTTEVCGEGTEKWTRRWRYGDYSKNGFSFGGVDYSGYASTNSSYQERITEVAITHQSAYNDCSNPIEYASWNDFGTAYNEMCDPYNDNDPDIAAKITAALGYPDGYTIDEWKGDKFSTLFSYSSAIEDHKSMLVVPWDNAEAVYLGKFTQDAIGGYSDVTTKDSSLRVETLWFGHWIEPDPPPVAYCTPGFKAKHKNGWGGGDVVEDNSVSGTTFIEDLILNFHGKDAAPVSIQSRTYRGPTHEGINFDGWGEFWGGKNCLEIPSTDQTINAKQSAHYLSHYIDRNPSGTSNDKTDNLPDVWVPGFVGYS